MTDAPADPLYRRDQLVQMLYEIGALVYTKDLEGRYRFANRLVCRLFGRPAEQVVGRPDESFLPPETARRIRDNDALVMRDGRTLECEETITFPDGTTRHFLTVKKPIRDAGGAIIGLNGVSTDITERRRLESALQDKTRLLDTLLNTVDAHIYMKDRGLRYLYANRQTCELYGRAPEQILGKTDFELHSPEIAQGFAAHDRVVFETGKRQGFKETAFDTAGVRHWFWSTKVPIVEADGRVEAYIGASSDLTETIRIRNELERLSQTDELTGIANRRHFMQLAEGEFERARRYRLKYSVISLDVDHFKQVNDRYGHHAGDAVLAGIAHTCRAALRSEDFIGRIGGEEFAVGLPHTGLDDAAMLAERLRKAVEARAFEGDWGGAIRTSISLGVAELRDETADFDRLLRQADAALYQAKDSGRNRICLASAAPGA